MACRKPYGKDKKAEDITVNIQQTNTQGRVDLKENETSPETDAWLKSVGSIRSISPDAMATFAGWTSELPQTRRRTQPSELSVA